MIRRDVLSEVKCYDESFKYAQDYKLYIDLLNNGFKIKNLNKTLYLLNTKIIYPKSTRKNKKTF